MTNREQLESSINYSEYQDSEIAEVLCDMIDAIGGMSYGLKEPLTKWLGLECDPETNNWGGLDKKERADYYEEDEEE